MDSIILYHGSEKIIEKPSVAGGRKNNDYGQGFYCTRHIELAKEWAVDRDRDGFVNEYEFEPAGLNILNLNDDKYSILYWITILLEHREAKLNTPVSKDGYDFLKKNYHIDISEYDVITGYRADDSYYSFARAFTSNQISIGQLTDAMYLGELGQQYFLQSKKAFSKIKYRKSLPADFSDYYPLKSARDSRARSEYQRLTSSFDNGGTYILDMIREADSNGTSL